MIEWEGILINPDDVVLVKCSPIADSYDDEGNLIEGQENNVNITVFMRRIPSQCFRDKTPIQFEQLKTLIRRATGDRHV